MITQAISRIPYYRSPVTVSASATEPPTRIHLGQIGRSFGTPG